MSENLFRGKDRTGILNRDWLFGCLDNLDEDYPQIIYKDRWGNRIIADVDKNTVGQFTGLTDKNGKKIFEGDIVKSKHTIRLAGTKEETQEKNLPRRAYGMQAVKTDCLFYSLGNEGERFDLIYYRNYVVKNDINGQRTKLQNGSDWHFLSASYVHYHELEVIGNIHDNTELLEVNQ